MKLGLKNILKCIKYIKNSELSRLKDKILPIYLLIL